VYIFNENDYITEAFDIELESVGTLDDEEDEEEEGNED
jgi:hypothetical protein